MVSSCKDVDARDKRGHDGSQDITPSMTAPRQGDLFRKDDASEERETPTWYPDPDRAAKSMPWDDDRTALYRTIFPQMTGCLPEEEGAQLRFDFETELARLEAA
jgi:hypothetical protein